MKQGDPDYLKHFTASKDLITTLLARTADLTELPTASLLDRLDLLQDVARFAMGPPVSADDFATLLRLPGKKIPVEEVGRALTLVHSLVDSARFPWVSERRLPTETERRVAVVATASIRAVERARTGRRTSEQGRQELYVAASLRGMNLTEIAKVRQPDKEMPEGSFKRDVKFEGKQCDVLVRLYDNPLFLAIECKSSNSAVNSIKRLNDIFEKAEVWRRARGAKVVTAAVVAGVFSLRSLETAQEKDVYLFWEHDLQPLSEYIAASKTRK